MSELPSTRQALPGGMSPRAPKLLPQEILETVPDALVAVDGEGTIVQVNGQTEALFGYERERLIGQKIEVLVPERYRSQHHNHRAEFAERPNVRRMGAGLDLYGIRHDGSEFPVEISLSPIVMPEGMLVLSVIRDISDRKKIENELRRANEELDRRANQQLWEYRSRLAAIIDSSQDAIIGKDLNGTITAWNKGAERLYGYSASEMLGKSISLLTPQDRQNEIPEILEKIRQGGSIEHYESVRVTKDGRHLNISLSVSPIHDADGEVIGASAIGRDITAHKRTEDQLRQAQKMEAVGRLAGGVAHDFNNILGIVTACAELLRDRVDPVAGSTPYIGNIMKAAQRGAALTRQLLAFSRQQVIQPKVLDLHERLKEMGKLLSPLMRDDVEVLIVPKSKTALVEVDPGQLDQIVLNLAVNARDAMPKGGKLILETSTMDCDESFAKQHPPMVAGKYVLLAVSDSGQGMDEATLSRIFEPFFTTKEIGKGTGLGLATVYGIVRQSNGHILAYSEPGRGTTFKIYFPCADDKVGLHPEPETDAVPVPRHGTTILLVEDDAVMRDLTRQMLEEQSYTVIEAKDGNSALEMTQASGLAIDLLLTDVVMRGIGGPELARRLSQLHPTLKVMYMSGYTGELLSDRDSLQPGIALLEKPFTRAALLKAVHAVLDDPK